MRNGSKGKKNKLILYKLYKMSEKNIENKYKQIVTQIGKIYNGETSNFQLMKIAKKIFGNKFKAVVSSDKIKTLKRGESQIINVDNSKQYGSHWCALARDYDNVMYFYDSYARNMNQLIPVIKKKFPNDTILYDIKNKEQDKNESNCGQRTLSWLIIFYDYSGKKAILIF